MKKKQKDEYRLSFEICDEKAHIKVYSPVITEEERNRRMKDLKEAVQNFWVEYYRQQERAAREKARKERGESYV